MHPVPVPIGEGEGISAQAQAGGVDQHVTAAARVADTPEGAHDLRPVGDVAGDGMTEIIGILTKPTSIA